MASSGNSIHTLNLNTNLNLSANPSGASHDHYLRNDYGYVHFTGVSVTPAQFPGLHTLGMSFARADLSAVGGVNPPHYHPRATKMAPVLAGRVYAGFVDTGGRLFAKFLVEGEVMVFPRGMVHFQLNVGDQPATVYGTFNSDNPGIVRIPATVFGSRIRDAVLERASGLTVEELRGIFPTLRRIEKRFGVPNKAELED
ncbi:germin-like protein 2-4 [Triticum aestivum]|uniref:germin-like protein 2-4 n=1 Tax=Triticum aestivum TaxID=4565 RepID=UPI001D02C389|nr:germin-like protein 2-4 [Triticum aestivum]